MTTNEVTKKCRKLSKGYEFYPKTLIVKSAGKFEGETIATLYYYDCFLNGGEVVFEISGDEKQAFLIGDGYKYVYLYESDNGFVHLYFCTSRAKAEAMESEDTDFEDDYQSGPSDFE